MTAEHTEASIRLDLNNPVFQKALFGLINADQHNMLKTLKKISRMTWRQIYSDYGLKWEAIQSRKGPGGHRLYTFRISRGFRAIGYRDGPWLRILSLHPDYDSAYHHQ